MYKVLIDKSFKGKPIIFDSYDIAISTLSLNENAKNLIRFSKNCFILSDEEYNNILAMHTGNFHQKFIEFPNFLIVFVDDINWEAINILYTLDSVVDREAVLKDVLLYNEQRILKMHLYRQTLIDLYVQMESNYRDIKQNIRYFNIKKAMRAFKKYFETSLKGDKILLTLSSVRLGNDTEGYITYNKIHIFVKNFKIEGFLLRFDNFDFSSYWGLPLILHPYLAVPDGFNGSLIWLPDQDYEAYADALFDLCTNYPTQTSEKEKVGLLNISTIIEHFQDLRKLWNNNRFKIQDRIQLSKTILKTKSVDETDRMKDEMDETISEESF